MSSDSKNLKRQILDLVREYYDREHKSSANFVKGKSRVPYAGRCFDEEELVNLVDSSLEFWLTYGRYSEAFEQELSTYLGIPFVGVVNSGSSANLLAFMSLTSPRLGERAVKPGDEVITVAAAFPTTVAPIVQYGAVPVFVDIDINTTNVDIAHLEDALSDRTKAVMLAHSLGNPFDLEAVLSFCEKNNLWLIEDNCDSLGSRYKGNLTGTFGDIGTSSFYPPHHITMGEGGAIYTKSPQLNRIMVSMRDWGRDCWCKSGFDNTCQQRFSQQLGSLPLGYDHKFVYSHFGYNLKPTDMQAAVGLAQLKKLPNFIDKRRSNHAFLLEELRDIEDRFILPQATLESTPAWFGFLLTTRQDSGLDRNRIVGHLEDHNVQTRNLFGGNILRHPCFDALERNVHYRIVGELKNTDRVMNDSFWVGVYPGMSEAMLEYMIYLIREAANR